MKVVSYQSDIDFGLLVTEKGLLAFRGGERGGGERGLKAAEWSKPGGELNRNGEVGYGD